MKTCWKHDYFCNDMVISIGKVRKWSKRKEENQSLIYLLYVVDRISLLLSYAIVVVVIDLNCL